MKPIKQSKTNHTIGEARAAGYDRAVYAYCDGMDLELLVEQDADLNQEFIAYDIAIAEFIKVYGWLLDFEEDDEEA